MDYNSEDERQPLLANPSKKRVSIFTYVGDFFNTLKAFIGTNYLSLPFAFAQSGVVLGVIGVFLIATLTDHCCQLLIKSKNVIIDRFIDQDTARRPLSSIELSALRAKLEHSISYGEVGRLTYGRWCEVFINLTVVFTQFLTCVCYFIFIANAIFTIFPMQLAMIPLNGSMLVNGSLPPGLDAEDPRDHLVNGIPMLAIPNLDRQIHRHSVAAWHPITVLPSSAGKPSDEYGSVVTSSPVYNISTMSTPSDRNRTTTISSPPPPSPTPQMYMKSIAPSLMYIVMIPAPFFLCTSLIRKMRILSPLTMIASAFLFTGAIAVLGFLIKGFRLIPDFALWKMMSLPLFIGQLTSAYEGIGCILPIQSSMDGNRDIFPLFLHIAIYVVFMILTSFGLLGYLRYGDHVQQIVIRSIPQHSVLAIMVDVTLVVSVLCTYPLQCFPVIQIMEGYIFGPGMCCAPASAGLVGEDDPGTIINEEQRQGLLERSMDSNVSIGGHEVAVEIPSKVPGWKRNTFRVLLTLIIMAMGVAMRNSYAYVSAFSGAVGCSMLAFILPCAIHLKLRQAELPMGIIMKDVAIILISSACSILVVVIIIYKIANHDISL